MGLAYPCGVTPGFDPTHIAAPGISATKGHVGVSRGGGWLNVLTGIPGTVQTAAPPTIDGVIGPSFVGANDVSGFTVPGQATSDTTFTIAAIVMPTSFPSSCGIFWSSTAGSTGNGLLFSAAAAAVLRSNTAIILTGPTVAANIPYFVVFSHFAGSTTNALVLNLNTGALLTATGSSANGSAASNGTYSIGKTTTTLGSGAQPGRNAAVMYNPTLFLTMPELMTWAADPWAFWYPNKDN